MFSTPSYMRLGVSSYRQTHLQPKYHIRESHATRGFLPPSAPGVPGGRVDIVISDVAACHTLIDNVVADSTRRDLVEPV